MRQQLVANDALRAYAIKYNMHLSLREGKAGVTHNSASATDTAKKSIADVFEAYIGAVIIERGLVDGTQTAYKWLSELYEPRLKEFESQMEGIAPLDKMAKQSLYALVGGHGATIEYKWLSGDDARLGYWYGVFLTGWGMQGEMLGKGWARNKNEAQLRAAQGVLANREWREEMARVKERYLGGRREREGLSREDWARVKEEQKTAAVRPLLPLVGEVGKMEVVGEGESAVLMMAEGSASASTSAQGSSSAATSAEESSSAAMSAEGSSTAAGSGAASEPS